MPRCSTCGQLYNKRWEGVTCKMCSGLIEHDNKLHSRRPIPIYMRDTWNDWLKMVAAAPRSVVTDKDMDMANSYFNGCAFCGAPHVEGRRLFVPATMGGRYYTYNVVPICGTCTGLLDRSKIFQSDPLRFYKEKLGVTPDRLDSIISYLQGRMFELDIGKFNFAEDSITVICKVKSNTSSKPFKGVWARRRFDELPQAPLTPTAENKLIADIGVTTEECEEVSWSLL